MQDIHWGDAAIVGAIIGGTFALAKEFAAFLFRRIESRLAERRRRVTIKARIAQFFAQNAVDAVRTLDAWNATIEALNNSGLLVGPQAPPIDFLRYEDATLSVDAVALADEFPDVITALTKMYEVREKIVEAHAAEHALLEGTSVLYLFPRTRHLVWALGQLGIDYLQRVVEILPENPWNPDKGARASFHVAAKNLKLDFKRFPILNAQDIRDQGLATLKQVRQAKAQVAAGA